VESMCVTVVVLVVVAADCVCECSGRSLWCWWNGGGREIVNTDGRWVCWRRKMWRRWW